MIVQGVCFESVQRVALRDVDDPSVEQPGDAIVRVELAGLCGSDLHAFFGRERGMEAGTVMGHEFVGQVVDVGKAVTDIAVGQRVCAPFTTNCGQCYYCRSGLTSRCVHGQLFGWRERGEGLHGGQAGLVRVPWADATLMPIPDGLSDDSALLLGDNLSTGHFAAELVGIQPTGIYAVVGCGTVGLLAIASAMRLGAETMIAIDPNETRLEVARQLGAIVFSSADEATTAIHDMTSGRGADGVMELVGLPAAQKLAYQLVRPGGTMSVIGCHCTPHFSFSPAEAYDKNLTYRTGRCPARFYMSQLADQWTVDPVDLSWCITHRFAIDEAEAAYDTFAHGRDNCIKAVLTF